MKAILRTGFPVLAIMLALTVPANAGPYEDGKTAYESKDYSTALKFWRPLAEQGNAEAQYNLGVMFATGKGVPKDNVTAQIWLDLATAQGKDIARQTRDELAKEMTPYQIGEAQSMAHERLAKHRQ